jgi:hypothetical protein
VSDVGAWTFGEFGFGLVIGAGVGAALVAVGAAMLWRRRLHVDVTVDAPDDGDH